MQFSLRSLLALFCFVVISIASLFLGGLAASLFSAFICIACAAILVNVFVAIDRLRAMSIGFTIPVVLYVGALAAFGSSEFDPHSGVFPTTKLFRVAYDFVYTPIYTDIQTGKIVPDYDPATVPRFGGGGGFAPGVAAMTGEFQSAQNLCELHTDSP